MEFMRGLHPRGMKQISRISIPQPCTQSWGNVLPNDGGGRFCNSCQKSVNDFSKLSNTEILNILSTSNIVCGKFTETQLMVLNSEIVPHASLFTWQKFGVVAALMAAVPFMHVQAKDVGPNTEQNPIQYKNKILPVDTQAIYKAIKGKVSDESNEPTPGVTVKIKGSTVATSTDINGNFAINVPANQGSILMVSFIGYQTQEVKVNASKNEDYNLQLKASGRMLLGEVVVIRKPPIWKRPYYRLRWMFRKIF